MKDSISMILIISLMAVFGFGLSGSIWYLVNRKSLRLRKEPEEARWIRLNRAFDHGGKVAFVVPMEVKFKRAYIKQIASQYGFKYTRSSATQYSPSTMWFKRIGDNPNPTRTTRVQDTNAPRVVAVKIGPFGRWRPPTPD